MITSKNPLYILKKIEKKMVKQQLFIKISINY